MPTPSSRIVSPASPLQGIGGALALGLLLTMFALPVYGIGVVLLLVLPPLLVWATLTDLSGRRGSSRALPPAHVRLFLAVVVVPAALLALLAPLRSLLLGLLSLHPPVLAKFHGMHEPLYRGLRALLGPDAVAWADVAWGAWGALAVLALAILDAVRRNLLAAQVERLPTSRVRSVAVGLAELQGRAVPLPGADPARPIIRAGWERSGDGWSPRTEVQPFLLDDGTGRLLVDPRGADIGTRSHLFSVALHQVKLRHAPAAEGVPEQRLMPGDEVHVLGAVQINDGADRREHPLVLRPRRASPWRIDLHDLFFVGHGREDELLRDFRRSVWSGWVIALLLMATSLWMSLAAWQDLQRPERQPLATLPAVQVPEGP